jgi:hypothetical protein
MSVCPVSRLRPLAVAIVSLLLVSVPLRAQGGLSADDPRYREILSVVTRLFDGMRTADSALVRSLFHPRAQLITTVVRDGVPTVQQDSLAVFVRSVGTPRPEPLDERIKNPRVLLDGTLAVVWTEYDLFLGARFVHCGVDAFHLARVGNAWQIVALADTRRRDGCTPGSPH